MDRNSRVFPGQVGQVKLETAVCYLEMGCLSILFSIAAVAVYCQSHVMRVVVMDKRDR